MSLMVRGRLCAHLFAVMSVMMCLLTPAHAQDQRPLRIAVVNTPQFSGLMDDLIADYKATKGQDVEVYSGNNVFEKATNGEADLIIAHYGKSGMEDFITKGLGSWPQLVFSNQMVLIGPPEDPAGIRGSKSAAEAFKRIAQKKSPFISNEIPSVSYLTSVLWAMAGQPDKTDWFIEEGLSKGRAIRTATERRAYVIFGAWPFLRIKKKQGSDLEILVADDPLLQRVMASVVVKADKIPGVNMASAEAFQKYLLSPQAQARVAAFRSPDASIQLWWPAARSNNSSELDE